MPSLDKFLSRFRTVPPPLHIRPDLLAAIQEIARQDGTSPSAVVDDLLTFALAERHSSNTSLAMWQQLTPREKEAAALIWVGLTNAQIAAHMVISVYTVRAHVRSILAKFGVHSKEELRLMLSSLDFSDWVDEPDAHIVPRD